MPFDPAHAEELASSRRGDGRQRVLKIEQDGVPVVVKFYGLKRNRCRTAMREFGSRFLAGKSSILPAGRFKTEKEVLRLWAKLGHDVPKLLEANDSQVDGEARYLVMEFASGPTLRAIFFDPTVPLQEKQAIMARFAEAMGRRHEQAMQFLEPRLLFEHPSFWHVILCNERLVHFDLEIVFTWKRDIPRLVRREIQGFLCSLAFHAVEDHYPALLDCFVAGYPDRALLQQVSRELSTYGSVPYFGWTSLFQRWLSKGKRYREKIPVGEALAQALLRG